MPKLRRTFSSVSAPFCWPTTATRWSPILAKPATIAGSSPYRRSPWSSMNSSASTARNSSVLGLRRFRASCTRSHVASFGSAGWVAAISSMPPGSSPSRRSASRPSLPRLRIRSTMDGLPGRREEAQDLGELALQVHALDDAVHEPVPEQELGPLEAGWQLLADGAGPDPSAGEADQRI